MASNEQDDEVKALAATHIEVLYAVCNTLGMKYKLYPIMPMSHVERLPSEMRKGIEASDLFAIEKEKGQGYTGAAPIWLSRELADGYALVRLGYRESFEIAELWGSNRDDAQFRDSVPS